MRNFHMLPPARIGLGAQPPLPVLSRHRHVGDTLNLPATTIASYGATVDQALQAMVTDLTANGCQQVDTPSVRAFQTAYNAQVSAGGNSANAISVDGLYGSQTQSAANDVNTTDQLGLTIPDGCVGSASASNSAGGSAGSSGSTSNGSSVSPTQSVTVSTGSPYTPYIIAGAIVLTGLGGYAVYHHEKTHGTARRAARHVARRVVHRRR